MSAPERDALIEAAATAFRARDLSGRILPSPDWADLTPEDRDVLFDLQLASRRLERAAHPQGLSSTARAVLARIELSGRRGTDGEARENARRGAAVFGRRWSPAGGPHS